MLSDKSSDLWYKQFVMMKEESLSEYVKKKTNEASMAWIQGFYFHFGTQGFTMKKFKVTGIYYTYISITLLLFSIQLFTILSADINIFLKAGTVIEADFTRMSV